MPNSNFLRPHLQMPKYKEIKTALKGRVLSRNTRTRKLRRRKERKKALARAQADNTEYSPEIHEDHSHDSTLCEFEHFWKIYVDLGLGVFVLLRDQCTSMFSNAQAAADFTFISV